MFRDNSDLSWEKWGKENPYYGVLTYNKFLNKNLNDNSKLEFFKTGQAHVERVLTMLTHRFGDGLSHGAALDFGCGVGRIVIPLSRIFEHVTGMDISSSMLDEAAKNCLARKIHNVNFLRADDELSKIVGRFDFIHSYLVFQHIPVPRGEKILMRLLESLNDNGVLAVHFPILRKASKVKHFVHFLRKNFKPVSVALNIARKKVWNEPLIQMNMYDLNRVSALLSKAGFRDIFIKVVDAGGFVSVFVTAQKTAKPIGKYEGEHSWAAKLDTV